MRLERLTQEQVEELAQRLGAMLVGGEVLLMYGPMGAGKTTFTRALARGMKLDDPERVCSPSYTLCMVHEGPVGLAHLDLFRLGEGDMAPLGSAGFESLGLEHEEVELLGPDRVLVVEWADLWLEPPPELVKIHITRDPARPAERTLEVSFQGESAAALVGAWLAPSQKAD